MHLYKGADYEDKRVSKRGDNLSSYKNLFPKIQNTVFNKLDMGTNENITFKPLYNISRRVQQDKPPESCFPFEDQHVNPSSNTSLLFKHYFEDKYSDKVNKQLFLKNQEKSLSLNFMKYRPLKQRLMHVLNKNKSGKKVVSFIDEKPVEKCEDDMYVGNMKKRNDLQNLRLQLKNIQNLCYKKRGIEIKPILKFSNRVKSMGKGVKKVGLNGREKLMQPAMSLIRKVVVNVMQKSANKSFGNHIDDVKLKELIKEELDAVFNEKIENYKNKHALCPDGTTPKSKVKHTTDDQTNDLNTEEAQSKLAARTFIQTELASIDNIIVNLIENRIATNEQPLSEEPTSSVQDSTLKSIGNVSSREGKLGKIKRVKPVRKNTRSPRKTKMVKNILQKSEGYNWKNRKQIQSKQSIFPTDTDSSKKLSLKEGSKKSSFSILKEDILNSFIIESKEGNKENDENVNKEKESEDNFEVETKYDGSMQYKESDYHTQSSLKQSLFDETDKYGEKERQLLMVTDSLEIIRAKMKKVPDAQYQMVGPKRKAILTNFQPGKRAKYQSILKSNPASPINKNKKVSFDMNIKKIL